MFPSQVRCWMLFSISFLLYFLLFLISVSCTAMAEGGKKEDDGMKYQHAVKNGSVYQNPWKDGNVPSLLAVRHAIWEKNRSNVPRDEVS